MTKAKPTAPDWEAIYGALSRIGVWGILLLGLFLLRSFFPLLFLTFVFSYILQRCVVRMGRRLPNRPFRVVAATVSFLTLLILVGNFLVPKFRYQAVVFLDRSPLYLETLDKHVADFLSRHQAVRALIPDVGASGEEGKDSVSPAPGSPVRAIVKMFIGSESTAHISETVAVAKGVGVAIVSMVSAFLLALLFSFLIVLDLPSLTEGICSLKQTRLRFIYDEVADSIYDFGLVLGRAFEAQLVIACLNTALTAFGLLGLGLDQDLAFLSVIVFLCSFVPVAGVFISSIPICLVALQSAGVSTMVLAVGMITIVHWIEAYILNPRIYGHHLRMNPVVVLIILTICGKLFHVWGLVLGVPVCNYLFSYAIRGKRA